MTIKIGNEDLCAKVALMREIKEDLNLLNGQYEQLKEIVTKIMGDADVLANADGEFLCTYSASKTFKKIDLEQLAYDEPELHSRLLNEYGAMSKSFKTFRLTK